MGNTYEKHTAARSLWNNRVKNLYCIVFAAAAAVMLATAGTAIAQTPDGETPAVESVCDVLQEEGTTKGLYGLCIAFCEAHDATNISVPVTEEEFQTLLKDGPNGKILTNYNKKKQETDPAMPCVLIQEPPADCPCWSADELANIDGFASTGEQLDFNCRIEPLHTIGLDISEIYEKARTNNRARILMRPSASEAICDFNQSDPSPVFIRTVQFGSFDVNNPYEQAEKCKIILDEYINASACSTPF